MTRWPDTTQSILDRNFSDHCPIILRSKVIDWGPKPFRVLDCWLLDKTFKDVVKECWTSGHQSGWGGFVLKEKIKTLKSRLKVWNKEHYGDTLKKVKQLEEELNRLEQMTMDRQLSPQEMMTRRQLQEDLWVTAHSHESLLRQKSRSRWIKEGDCNSRYFHLMMNASRRQNLLKGIMLEGSWVIEPQRVKEAVREFFQQRFNEPEPIRPTLDGIPFLKVNQQQNAMLVGRFEEEEVRKAIWDCGSDKSPGPDGLNFKFIKKFWKIIKPDILRFLDGFYVNGIFPKGGNASFIALIPKVPDPQQLSEYRPISLIGCIYKIVSKILARRLKKVMSSIIDERQSAFIEGRHLLHGVLVANEVVEEAKRKQKSCIVFKVDYEKAYDFVSWQFLIYMMRRMDFNPRWIMWIERDVNSQPYNGKQAYYLLR